MTWTAIKPRGNLWWQIDMPGGDHGAGLIAGNAIGHAGARGDLGWIIAGHVRNNKRDNTRWVAGGGKATALDAGHLFADGVHDGNRRAGGKKGAVQGSLVIKRQIAGGAGQQCGAATANEGDNEIVSSQSAYGIKQRGRGGKACGIGNGMGGFEHANVPGGAGITITRDNNAAERSVP
jgi:hypothetical protein